MSTLEFGIFDSFGPFEMEEFPRVVDVYEAHMREAQEAEQLGYRYYFFIEPQNSPVCAVTAPNIYLTALASRTSALRFGLMIYQLPFHHPVRLAWALATLDQFSHLAWWSIRYKEVYDAESCDPRRLPGCGPGNGQLECPPL